MFMNKKIRMIVALICASSLILANSVAAIAAPYSNIEDIRNKALSNYLSANNIIAVVSTKAPALVEEAVKLSGSDVLVTYKEETVTEEIPFNTIKRLNMGLDAGETVIVREGVEGKKVVQYDLKFENGKEVSREVIESYVAENPVDRIVEYGVANNDIPKVASSVSNSTDTSKLNYKYVIECEATAYDMSAEENGGYAGQTATGVPLGKGVIAVDPRVIPLGSRVYVEALDGSWSYGYAVAADTGGAIKGKRVDLCYKTRYECIQFGRRACRVYVLN